MAAARRSVAEIATGAVIIVLALGFLGYALVATGRDGGGSGLRLTAQFDNIGGIASGADVRLAGVKVGSVASDDDRSADVRGDRGDGGAAGSESAGRYQRGDLDGRVAWGGSS